jgi:hypothetical protein
VLLGVHNERMASAKKRVNWPDLRAEYVSDQMTTFHSLAAKYGVSAKSVEWHALREGWSADRKAHSAKVVEKLGDRVADSAADALAEIHRQHLTATRELRQMIAHKLKVRTTDGQIVLRADISAGDLARIAQAYAVLLESDRVALGADELPVNHPRDPYSDLSDEQIYAKVQAMLERHPVKSVQ